MGLRGPKLAVSYKQRIREIKRHNIFNEDGTLKKEQDQVWQIICTNINQDLKPSKPLRPRNLQYYVHNNIDKVKQDLGILKSSNSSLEMSEKSSSIVLSLDTEEKLVRISRNAMYKGIVREENVLPLSIFYWPKDAIYFVSELKEQPDFCLGSFQLDCNLFARPCESVSDDIFLYVLRIEVSGQLIPICQVITEGSEVSLFTRFFNECRRAGLRKPSTVRLNCLPNQFVAARKVFNVNEVYEDDLNRCFNALVTNDRNFLPKCITMVETNCLLALEIKSWEFIAVRSQLDKYFFIQCVLLLIYQSCLQDFETVLEKVFVVAYSRYKTEEFTNCFNSIQSKITDCKIDKIYSAENIQIYERDAKTKSYRRMPSVDYEQCLPIVNRITSIFVQARKSTTITGAIENSNGLFKKEFCRNLMRLCTEFVVWSKVMTQLVGNNKHASQDLLLVYKDEFHEYIKNKVLTDATVSEYLIENISFSAEKLVSAKFSAKKQIGNPKKISVNNSHLLHEDQWKGRNKPDILAVSEESATDRSGSDENSSTESYGHT